jgi:hypothetical protein
MRWRWLILGGIALCAAACAPARAAPDTAAPGLPADTLTPVVLPIASATATTLAAPATAAAPTTSAPPTLTPAHFHTSTPAHSDTPPPTPTHLGLTTIGRAEHFELVGRQALGSRGWNTGLALAGPCAYIGNRRLPQIAIVDVSDPAEPAPAGELALAPGSQPVELRTVTDLNLLVVMNFSPGITFITFDITNCFDPRPLGSLGLGAVPHEFFLWRDPTQPARLLAYAAMFYDVRPDLHVVDLTDPTAPQWVASWKAPADGAGGSLHSISVSPDGWLAYLALTAGGLLLADTSDFAIGLPEPRLRLLRDEAGFSAAPAAAAHSAVALADPRYILVTEEVYFCPFAGLFVADAAQPAHPQIISRFRLPESAPPCDGRPDSTAVYTAHNPLVVGDLAFITWYAGGLQVLDLSDPAQPVRVALYVPDGAGASPYSYIGSHPVQLWSYPVLRDGLLYVSDIQSGLHILRYTGPGAAAINAVPLAEGNVTVHEDTP